MSQRLFFSCFLLLVLVELFQTPEPCADIQKIRHYNASHYRSAWGAGSTQNPVDRTHVDPSTDPSSIRSNPARNTYLWNFRLDTKEFPPTLYRSNRVNPNESETIWGTLPEGDAYSEIVAAHGRLWLYIRQGKGWRIYQTAFSENTSQWQPVGSERIDELQEFFLNRTNDPIVIWQERSTQPNTQQTPPKYIREGEFTGGGSSLQWGSDQVISELEAQRFINESHKNGTQPELVGEFDVGGDAILLAFSWKDMRKSGVQVRFRISSNVSKGYGPWSDPLSVENIQLNERGRFFQYQITPLKNEILPAGVFPDLELTYTFDEPGSELGKVKDQHSDSSGGGGSGKSTGLGLSTGGIGSGFATGITPLGVSNAGGKSALLASALTASKAKNAGKNLLASRKKSGNQSNTQDNPISTDDPSNVIDPLQNPKSDDSLEENSTPPSEEKSLSPNLENDPNTKDEPKNTDSPQDPSNPTEMVQPEDSPQKASQESIEKPDSQPESQPSNPENTPESDPDTNPDADPNQPDSQLSSSQPSSPSMSQPNNPDTTPSQESEPDSPPDNGNGKKEGFGSGGGNPSKGGSGSGNTGSGGGSSSQGGQSGSSEQGSEQNPNREENGATDKDTDNNLLSKSSMDNPSSPTVDSASGSKMNDKESDQNENEEGDQEKTQDEDNPDSTEPVSDRDANGQSQGTMKRGGSGAGGHGGASGASSGIPGDKGGDFSDSNLAPMSEAAMKTSAIGDLAQKDAHKSKGSAGTSGFQPRVRLATDDIEDASSSTSLAALDWKEKRSNTKWWLLLLGTLLSYAGWRTMRRKQEDCPENDPERPDENRDWRSGWIEEIDQDCGCWDHALYFHPDVAAANLCSGSLFLMNKEGVVQRISLAKFMSGKKSSRKEEERENPSSTSFMEKMASLNHPLEEALMAKRGTSLFLFGKDLKENNRLLKVSLPAGNKPTKGKKLAYPDELQSIQSVETAKGTLWVIGENKPGQRGSKVFSASLANLKGDVWREECPAVLEQGEIVAISSGEEVLIAGIPNRDPNHLWVFQQEENNRGRWRAVAKTQCNSEGLLIHAAEKRCILVELARDERSIVINLFPRDDQGRFTVRASNRIPLPHSGEIFGLEIVDGRLFLLGREINSESNTPSLMLFEARVGELLKGQSSMAA